jgi:hypothetical protein
MTRLMTRCHLDLVCQAVELVADYLEGPAEGAAAPL